MKMKAIVTLPLLALLTLAVDAQEREATGGTAPSADSDRSQIVGHWVAEKTSSSGLGSVWEFKPDGTLTITFGVVANGSYRLEGDTLILPPETSAPGAAPQRIRVRIEGNHLYERYGDSEKEGSYVRIKGGKPGDAAIVGVWKSDMPLPGTKLDEAFKNATFTYTRDGIAKMRAALRSSAGRYDLTNRTYSLDSADLAGARGPGRSKVVTGRFELRDGKLYLTQPGGQTEEVYVRDDFE